MGTPFPTGGCNSVHSFCQIYPSEMTVLFILSTGTCAFVISLGGRNLWPLQDFSLCRNDSLVCGLVKYITPNLCAEYSGFRFKRISYEKKRPLSLDDSGAFFRLARLMVGLRLSQVEKQL
jgi:hypothetical protein